MKYQFRRLFIGIILGAIVSSMTAFATTSTLTKDVTYRNIKIVVDANEITPTDANGTYVEPFIIDGTTYLPVRAVANAFGKVTDFDVCNTVALKRRCSVKRFCVYHNGYRVARRRRQGKKSCKNKCGQK